MPCQVCDKAVHTAFGKSFIDYRNRVRGFPVQALTGTEHPSRFGEGEEKVSSSRLDPEYSQEYLRAERDSPPCCAFHGGPPQNADTPFRVIRAWLMKW